MPRGNETTKEKLNWILELEKRVLREILQQI